MNRTLPLAPLDRVGAEIDTPPGWPDNLGGPPAAPAGGAPALIVRAAALARQEAANDRLANELAQLAAEAAATARRLELLVRLLRLREARILEPHHG